MKRLRASTLFRLLYQMARFAAGSFLAYSVEIGSFALLIKIVFRRESEWIVLLSMGIARALSILVQYSANRYMVFRSRIHLGVSFGRYLLVNLSLLGCSYVLVRLARQAVSLDITLVKVAVDLILFFANYTLNRLFVFAGKGAGGGGAEAPGATSLRPASRISFRPRRRPRRKALADPSATESSRPDPG